MPPQLFVFECICECLLVVALEDAVNGVGVHLLCEEADDCHYDETAYHSNGTAVDWVEQ